MADYLVTGKKGNGKSLVCVGRIRDALMDARPVATNLDLRLEKLLPLRLRNTRAIRLPDKPTRADLDALGKGNESYDESRNGVLVLDEMATWLNARTYQDRDRQGVLEWLAFSRKLGWDTYLICQNANQIDKQVREALCEYHVICRRLDRLKIPFVPLRFPRIHVAFVKFGMDRDSMMSERWVYRGNDLFKGYDTKQVFRSEYDSGVYSYLPPWHLEGWRAKPFWQKVREYLQGKRSSNRPLNPKPKLPEVEALMRLDPDQRMQKARELMGYA